MEPVKTTRRAQITREKILDAALALVAKNGPENLTLTDVVRHSGVHRATIYQHFKMREDVLDAVSERFASKFYREVLPAITMEAAPLPGGQAVVDLTNRFVEFVMNNPDMGQIWLHRLLNSPDPSLDPIWSAYKGSFQRLLQSEASKDDLDAEVLAMLILSGTMIWPLWTRLHTNSEEGRRSYVSRFTENLFRISMHGIWRPELFPDVTRYLDSLKERREQSAGLQKGDESAAPASE